MQTISKEQINSYSQLKLSYHTTVKWRKFTKRKRTNIIAKKKNQKTICGKIPQETTIF